jgi:hypothetical protein
MSTIRMTNDQRRFIVRVMQVLGTMGGKLRRRLGDAGAAPGSYEEALESGITRLEDKLIAYDLKGLRNLIRDLSYLAKAHKQDDAIGALNVLDDMVVLQAEDDRVNASKLPELVTREGAAGCYRQGYVRGVREIRDATASVRDAGLIALSDGDAAVFARMCDLAIAAAPSSDKEPGHLVTMHKLHQTAGA